MKEEFDGYNDEDGLDIEITKEDIERTMKKFFKRKNFSENDIALSEIIMEAEKHCQENPKEPFFKTMAEIMARKTNNVKGHTTLNKLVRDNPELREEIDNQNEKISSMKREIRTQNKQITSMEEKIDKILDTLGAIIDQGNNSPVNGPQYNNTYRYYDDNKEEVVERSSSQEPDLFAWETTNGDRDEDSFTEEDLKRIMEDLEKAKQKYRKGKSPTETSHN